MHGASDPSGQLIAGRYVCGPKLGSGGMATVYLGELRGAAGFRRPVAIKRMHPAFAGDRNFCAMFIDEARLASRISHPNVIPTLDVVNENDQLYLIMEYVEGISLSRLRGQAEGGRMPPGVAVGIVSDVLHGLHAAHTAEDDRGNPLGIVHRDISPQNVFVGFDGIARVHDFGVAKASGRLQTTLNGELKGKLSYMAPEQLSGGSVDRRADVFATSIVLWEILTGRRLFHHAVPTVTMERIDTMPIPVPSLLVSQLPKALDAVIMRGLARPVGERFATAAQMATALEDALTPASAERRRSWMTQIGAVARRAVALRLDDAGDVSTEIAITSVSELRTRPRVANAIGASEPSADLATTVSRSRAPAEKPSSSAGTVPVNPTALAADQPMVAEPSVKTVLRHGREQVGSARRLRSMVAPALLGAVLATAGLVALTLKRPGNAPASTSSTLAPEKAGAALSSSAASPSSAGAHSLTTSQAQARMRDASSAAASVPSSLAAASPTAAPTGAATRAPGTRGAATATKARPPPRPAASTLFTRD